MNGLSKEQLGHFRRRLEEMRDQAKREVNRGTRDAQRALENIDAEHDESDGAVLTDNVDRTLQVGSMRSDQVDASIAALDRMDRGDYGRCVSCNGDIGFDRLEAMPTAIRCADCASVGERPRPRSI